MCVSDYVVSSRCDRGPFQGQYSAFGGKSQDISDIMYEVYEGRRAGVFGAGRDYARKDSGLGHPQNMYYLGNTTVNPEGNASYLRSTR
jgi:hypothetical protein